MTTRITTDNITDATISTADLASSVPLNTQWQAVKTSDFTAVAGEGYFVDTTSAAVEVTLPASPSAGDTVVLKDYARTWNTNNVTLASAKFDGVTLSNTFSTNGQTVTLVYMDGTKGWSLVNEDTSTNLGGTFISATGGTVTTSGDFKIHTFTGDGCFVVSSLGTNIPASNDTVDYLVVAGGGGGGARNNAGGGGGAGGYRESKDSTLNSPHTASPLAATTGLTITATTYPVTVGAGGSGSTGNCGTNGTNGSNSVFSTITSAGGGYGGNPGPGANSGGSGGGGGGQLTGQPGGSGNTPPTSPPQGNNGGTSTFSAPGACNGAGGGGATVAGGPSSPSVLGVGGAGGTTSISGTSTSYAGGGGGGSYAGPGSGGAGGLGGGGAGGGNTISTVGTANTGGGGGGSGYPNGGCGSSGGATGGKGIVIIRYRYQ